MKLKWKGKLGKLVDYFQSKYTGHGSRQKTWSWVVNLQSPANNGLYAILFLLVGTWVANRIGIATLRDISLNLSQDIINFERGETHKGMITKGGWMGKTLVRTEVLELHYFQCIVNRYTRNQGSPQPTSQETQNRAPEMHTWNSRNPGETQKHEKPRWYLVYNKTKMEFLRG